MTQSFMPHLSDTQKPLPPTFFPMTSTNNHHLTSSTTPSPFNSESVLSSTIGQSYSSNPFSQPFPILSNKSNALLIPSPNTQSILESNIHPIKTPLTMHEKKKMKTNELIRAKQSNHSDSSSSSSDESVMYPHEIKPIQTVSITTTRKNSAVGSTTTGLVVDQQPTIIEHHQQQNKSKKSPQKNFNTSIPILSFSNFWRGEIPSHIFVCKEGFLLNDSKKAPPDTSHNLTIRDSLHLASQAFNRCTCKLKLKDGSADGILVSTEAFKPNNMNNVTTYECTITIPQKITTLKGSSSSRIGYVEIYNQEDECIAVSSFFWIRSRSRLQLDKDTKRKMYIEPGNSNSSFESQKRKRDDESDDSDNKKFIKTEESSVVVQQPPVVVVATQQPEPTMPTTSTTTNVNNTLPPISTFCAYDNQNFLQTLYTDMLRLKEVVSNQQKEIAYLKEVIKHQN